MPSRAAVALECPCASARRASVPPKAKIALRDPAFFSPHPKKLDIMIHDPVRLADPDQLPLFDEEALDIADYLRAEADAEADIHHPNLARQSQTALVIGAVGVVYGDIGTSPIYAFREALHATAAQGAAPGRPEVLGVLSLLIWTLVLIVTVKYIFALLRADNRGEGGVLALYTLVRLAAGKRSIPVLVLV